MTATDPASSRTPSSKLKAKRWNERVRFGAAALDRCGTVVLAGAVLAPLFQERSTGVAFTLWFPVVLMLPVVGQLLRGLLREEL